MEPITIAIADDHPVIGQGLGCTLAADHGFRLLWVAESIEKLTVQMRLSMPDVLVLDVVMPGANSINAFIDLLREFPGLNIVAYTSLNNPTLVNMLYRAGVRAYISKNLPVTELVEAMRKASLGQSHIPRALSSVVRYKFEPEVQEPFLTPREQEVLRLISQEQSSSEIADALSISVNTVEFHRKKLFEKFGVKNVAGLVREAMSLGYLA